MKKILINCFYLHLNIGTVFTCEIAQKLYNYCGVGTYVNLLNVLDFRSNKVVTTELNITTK